MLFSAPTQGYPCTLPKPRPGRAGSASHADQYDPCAVARRGRAMSLASLALGLVLAVPNVSADDSPAVAAAADAKLRAMSDYLSGLTALSVDIDADQEVIDLAGQKLQYSSSMRLWVQRPDRLKVERNGPFAQTRLDFDGKSLRLSTVEPAIFAEIPAEGDVEAAIRALRYETGLDAPAGDLFFDDPYAGLVTDLTSGADLGTAFVNGVECHHLAFRAKQVDWQIWIQAGDAPLPMKYVITSKWVTGAPQFAARFRNWDTAPTFTKGTFDFVPVEGAAKVEQIPVNAVGELVPNGEQR